MEKEMKHNKKISKFQLYFLLIQCQIGIGVLSLPSVTQKTAKGDAWLSTIIAGIGIEVILVIYWLLLRRFPTSILTEVTEKILGKMVGRILNGFIYIYFVLVGSYALILCIRLTNRWILPLTPPWILALFIIIASLYLTIDDIRIVARFFTFASFLYIALIVISLFNFSHELDIHYVIPVGQSGLKNIMLGSNESLISMLGFEILLVIYPNIQNKEKGYLKTISFANLSVTTLYTYFVFINLISFSPRVIKQIKEPVLYMFRGLSSEIIDRLDLVFVTVWIVPMTTSVMAYLFMASKSLSKQKNSYSKIVVVNSLLIYAISLIPFDDEKLNQFSKFIQYLSYGLVFGAPLLLLLLSYMFKKQEMDEM
ncbi:GerAB/ArcD/ProY family transporter [Neobacillus ginsengisoli]|uniref:Spore germination protein (Amino acid permease) n=1 Tax=Neobacillus ginsengisoli TaxID=904295 RepID=A0ABT9Y3H4_9BACI|nr:endospore germination permease [Neobacillus ginsengisoli]MDQ0202286.1 spore germination protein (amino acid permease) [Neobacillus ginsengisoli]